MQILMGSLFDTLFGLAFGTAASIVYISFGFSAFGLWSALGSFLAF